MDKRVVIIGGGFAGTKAAKSLETIFNVTLLDIKDYFEYTPSILRTITEPKVIRKIQIPYLDCLKYTVFIKGEVQNITETEVITSTHTLPYDYLIISSGSVYSTPIKDFNFIVSQRAKEMISYAEKLRKSSSILIIGGGIVGVELAAEIASGQAQGNAHHKSKECCQRGDQDHDH